MLQSSGVGFPTSTAELCLQGACPWRSRQVGAQSDWLWQQIMVVNSAEPVPGTVCSTRRSRISDQQCAPRAALQCSWIPNQHGCGWHGCVCKRDVFAGGMPPALTAGWGSLGLALATDHSRKLC